MSRTHNFFGRAMKVARASAGIDQTRMADRLCISKGYVSMLETGSRTPSWEIVLAVSEMTGVSLSAMFRAVEEADAEARLKELGS